MERWLAAVLIFAAAIIYAWLAGVIVELVSRAGEDTRNIDGTFDMLVGYLEVVNFPRARRREYIRFYWHARPYLLMSSLKDRLPDLSAKLTGELVQFNHGRTLKAIPIFNCAESDERARFHVAIAQFIETRLFVADEAIRIDALYVILEGLLLLNARLRSRGMVSVLSAA